MAITYQDISLVLSGGSTNVNPNLSIGGDPSSQPITGLMDNLFADVTSDESEAGVVDYRCFYIFNDNSTDGFFDVKLGINSKVSGGSSVLLGVRTANETQQFVFDVPPVFGNTVFQYEQAQVNFNGTEDINVTAANLAAALNSTYNLTGVTVVGSTNTSGNMVLTVFFQGADGNRSHDLMTFVSSTMGNATITRISGGSPINAIADDIDIDITPPNGVTFLDTTTNPILIGNLYSGDGAPIWVQRTVTAGTAEMEDDGFGLLVTGSPFA